MTEYILSALLFLQFITIGFLVIWITRYAHKVDEERREYMKALMSKNVTDYVVAKKIEDNVSGKVDNELPEFVEVREADDETFDKMMDNINKE